MAKVLISIKADREVKEQAQRVASGLGLSLSVVMNAALRNFIRTREVHVSSIPHMTPEFELLLGRIEKDIKTKENISPVFSTAQAMDEYLDDL